MPDKHEVGGSSPLGPTNAARREEQANECISKPSVVEAWAYQCLTFMVRYRQMLIENRIKKRNETQIVVRKIF